MTWERAAAGADLDELFEQLESWHDGGRRGAVEDERRDDEQLADA